MLMLIEKPLAQTPKQQPELFHSKPPVDYRLEEEKRMLEFKVAHLGEELNSIIDRVKYMSQGNCTFEEIEMQVHSVAVTMNEL